MNGNGKYKVKLVEGKRDMKYFNPNKIDRK